MEQNPNTKIQKLIKELSLLEHSFINNIATPQHFSRVKEISAELYLLSDLAKLDEPEAPIVKVDPIAPIREITDFYHPVEQHEEPEPIAVEETPQVIVEEVKIDPIVVSKEIETPQPQPVVEPKIEVNKAEEKSVTPPQSNVQLTKLLNLSKKFEYTRALFGGDGSQLETFLNEASSQGNKASVKKWFDVKISANGWSNKADLCDELLAFMQRNLP